MTHGAWIWLWLMFRLWYWSTHPLGHSKLIFSFWSYPSFLHDMGGWVIKTIGLPLYYEIFDIAYSNIMPFVTKVAFVMYQKVHLLLDDIAVVAVEGDERCLGGPWMHRLCSTFQNYVIGISSMDPEIHANRCVVLINWIMKNRHRQRTRN